MPGPIFSSPSINHEKDKDTPWWVRAIITIGVPSVLALGGAYYVVARLDAQVIDIQTNLKLHQLDSSYLIKANQEQTLNFKALLIVTQQTCINTSRTEEARQTCWNPWREIR